MAEVQFSIMQLIEESVNSGDRFVFPTSNSFATLEDTIKFNDNQTLFEITVEKTEDYIFFVFNFGNPTPRDENLTNIHTGEKRENSRTITEVELNNQAFFLYHYQKNLLYLSNSQKKVAFEKMLKEKPNTDFKLKTLFKDIDAFLQTLKECSRINFSHINDLFSSDSTKKQALADLTGTDTPNEFTITAKYNKHSIENFIRNLSQEKTNNKISSLSILFSSPLRKKLWDTKNKFYKTELHRIKDYYKHSIVFESLSVIMIFIIPKTLNIDLFCNSIHLGKQEIVFPILAGSAYCLYKTCKDLFRIFTFPTND